MKKPVLVLGIVLIVVLAAALITTGIAFTNSKREHLEAVGSLEARLAETQVESDEMRAELTETIERLDEAEARVAAATTALERANATAKKLRKAYNALYTDYEDLYFLAATFAGGGSYTPSYDPIHCTSSTISGYYVYTNCY